MTTGVRGVIWRLIAVALVTGSGSAAMGQSPTSSGTTVFRAQVLDAANAPIRHASVEYGVPIRRLEVDANARFSIAVDAPADSLSITVRALGFAPVRRTLRPGRTEIVRLVAASHQLPATTVTSSRRRRPSPTDVAHADSSTVERSVAYGAVGSTEQGDLATTAGAIPGVLGLKGDDDAPASFSVLGLPAAENLVVRDGQRLPVAILPREVLSLARLTLATGDAARGGFSGALYDVRTAPGGSRPTRSLFVSLDQPAWQSATPESRAYGLERTGGIVSAVAAGPIRSRMTYSVGAQLSSQRTNPPTFETADATGFAIARADTASAANLRRVLSLSAPISPSARRTLGQLFARADMTRGETDIFSVVQGIIGQHGGLGLSPVTAMSEAQTSRQRFGSVLLGGTHYHRDNSLTEIRAGASQLATRLSSFSEAPRLIVATPDSVGDTAGLPSFLLGGSGRPAAQTHLALYDARLSHSASLGDNRHDVDIGLSFTGDDAWADQARVAPSLWFPNVDAFSNGTPLFAQYRVAEPSTRVIAQTSAVFISDLWRPSERLRVQIGSRIERSHLHLPGCEDPRLQEGHSACATSISTPAVPLPRLSIGWQGGVRSLNLLGTPASSDYMIRAVFGEFRSSVPSSTLAQWYAGGGAMSYVCLADSSGAVPLSPFEGVPGQCLGNAPTAVGLDRSYETPISRRLLVNWTGRVFEAFRGSVEGIITSTRHEPSVVDVNLRTDPVATLIQEQNRPVYSLPAPDSGQGAVVSRAQESRADPAAGQVFVRLSDLRSRGWALSFQLFPQRKRERFTWQAFYTLSESRMQTRGFDATTAGDPREPEWSPSALDVRHQLGLALVARVRNTVHVIAYERLRSGLPFTPLVGADVNGDGLINDRAMIPRLDQIADPVLRGQYESLLSALPTATRDCLNRQAGRIAGQNSCRGPWSSTLNLEVGLNSAKVGLPERMYVSVSVANAGAMLDHLVHGSRDHGWGQSASVDPVLFRANGVAAAGDAYRYFPNARFGGRVSPLSRLTDPARLTLDVRIDLGPPSPTMGASRVIGGAGAARRRPSAQEILPRLVAAVSNPAGVLISLNDSLHLSDKQRRALEVQRGEIAASLVRALGPVADSLAGLPGSYDTETADRFLARATLLSLSVLREYADQVRQILTEPQYRILPPVLRLLLDSQTVYMLRPAIGSGFGRMLFRPDP